MDYLEAKYALTCACCGHRWVSNEVESVCPRPSCGGQDVLWRQITEEMRDKYKGYLATLESMKAKLGGSCDGLPKCKTCTRLCVLWPKQSWE